MYQLHLTKFFSDEKQSTFDYRASQDLVTNSVNF